MTRTYSELIRIPSFEERFEYLKLSGKVGQETFGYDRFLNQAFYRSRDLWKPVRDEIIIRDDALDLGMEGYPIKGRLYIHHINPITLEDLEELSPRLTDPENLICVSYNTHQAIHYGDKTLLPQLPVERRPWDTCPWRS